MWICYRRPIALIEHKREAALTSEGKGEQLASRRRNGFQWRQPVAGIRKRVDPSATRSKPRKWSREDAGCFSSVVATIAPRHSRYAITAGVWPETS